MAIETNDYLDVAIRAEELGMPTPPSACILPRGFSTATRIEDLVHESSALDLKILFRQAEIPIAVYQPDEATLPYIQENDFTWVGPIIFFSAAELTNNPELVAVAVNVISGYLNDLFKGLPTTNRVKLSIVLESTTTKSSKKTVKKVDFDGPSGDLGQILDVVKKLK